MSAYRNCATVEQYPEEKKKEEEQPGIKVGAGRLFKKVIHKCVLPGYFSRLFSSICEGDVWICDECDLHWEWSGVIWRSHDAKNVYYSGDCQVCEEQKKQHPKRHDVI